MSPAAAPPLVGRETELVRLIRLLERASAAETRAQVAMVEGPPGIGKSRLLAEVAGRGRRTGAAVIQAACHELEAERPFGAWIDASVPGELSGVRAAIDRLLKEAFPGEAAVGLGLRFGAADQLAAAVRAVAADRTVLLVVDDLQWADGGTLLTLGSLIGRGEPAPIAVVLACRPDPRSQPLRALLAGHEESSVDRIPLPPLDETQAAALARSIVGAPLGPSLDALVRDAAGSPMLISELLTALTLEGQVVLADGRTEVPGVLAPATLRASLLRRLSFLPDASVATLRIAALFGGPFLVAHLGLATTRPATVVAYDLAPAIRNGLLVERGDRLDFAHDLIRTALYEEMPAAERRARHRELGIGLAEAGAEPQLVATHLALGATSGDELAIDWLRRAARRVEPTAPTIAVDLLERAAAIARPDQDVAADIAAERADALMLAGRGADAEVVARRALTETTAAAGRWRLQQALGEVLYWNERYPEATAALESALARADGRAKPRLLAVLADSLVAEGLFERAREAGEAALGLVDPDDAVVRWMINDALAYERFLTGFFSDAIPYALTALEAARTVGPRLTWFAEPAEARFFNHADRFDESEAILLDPLGDPDRARWPVALAYRIVVATRMYRGDWRQAALDFELAERTGASESVGLARTAALTEMARLAVHSGDVARARQLLEATRGERSAARLGDTVAWTEAVIADAEGRTVDAAAWIERGIAEADGRGVIARYRQLGWDLVRIGAHAGRRDLALHALERIQRIAERANVRSIDGLALQCRGFLDGDIDACRQAVVAYRASPRVFELARACETVGRVALDHGDRAEAARSLTEAARLFDAMPATAEAARVRALLRAIGIRVSGRRPRARASTGWDALTAAERDVVRLVAEGLANGQIADRLYISKRTVETHIWRAYAKLGASSRVDLARIAIAEGTTDNASTATSA